ncbi:MAG TPA: glycine cleavage system protein GcvH [Candidatus Limiplasma sp.]|nr:glycine cleavage system protein GcvH [Candidatus Limiplasma sp.]HRX09018.1 glycine cleavage system protein GcvH [Candidatus Limiplasma sp.]
MEIKQGLWYAKTHEWVEFIDDMTAAVGLSDYAQHELGDLVFVNLPQAGDTIAVGKMFADVESVKAVSDIYAPVAGTVSEVNETLLDAPEAINQSPYEAWIAKVEGITARGELMDADAYAAYLDTL